MLYIGFSISFLAYALHSTLDIFFNFIFGDIRINKSSLLRIFWLHLPSHQQEHHLILWFCRKLNDIWFIVDTNLKLRSFLWSSLYRKNRASCSHRTQCCIQDGANDKTNGSYHCADNREYGNESCNDGNSDGNQTSKHQGNHQGNNGNNHSENWPQNGSNSAPNAGTKIFAKSAHFSDWNFDRFYLLVIRFWLVVFSWKSWLNSNPRISCRDLT